MKKFILPLLLVIIAFASCESTEDNNPGLQSNIDSVFFSANDVLGFRPQNGSVVIQGFTSDEIITLHPRESQLINYPLGVNQESYATYEDANGVVYTTNPHGSGVIQLTAKNIPAGWFSGKFKFTAVSALGDTVTINRGVFYKAPVDSSTLGEDGGTGDGFSAQIGGIPFLPININTSDSGSSITITGGTTSTTLLIRVPANVGVGNYALPANGFLASYSEGALTEIASGGNISVITHDTTARTISGSFSFTTPGQIIEAGQFNVSY